MILLQQTIVVLIYPPIRSVESISRWSEYSRLPNSLLSKVSADMSF